MLEVHMAKDTKERILAAALELFSQNGYAGTNIRELTASLGLVKSAMYKHFESKEDIWNTLLASGGGQQMPVFAALGAFCTVLDYSPLQLESERVVAEREGYDIKIIRGDMTKRLPFEDNEFDIVFHPVSNC
jgi:AcrR family transcriptional regulator